LCGELELSSEKKLEAEHNSESDELTRNATASEEELAVRRRDEARGNIGDHHAWESAVAFAPAATDRAGADA
jgi:hypothetical protein